MTNDRLDNILTNHLRDGDAEADSVQRIMTALAKPLPRQNVGLWRRLPGVLLDWQFAPAWPRVAALAGCAVIGFGIGLAGIDRQVDDQGSPFSVTTTADLATLFEPEPLTGERP